MRVRSGRERSINSILPVVLLACASLLPQEIRITIAEQSIYPWRAVCLLLTPWILVGLASGKMQLRPADLLMFLGSLWTVLSFIVIYGLAKGVVSGGALAVDIILPYLIARLCIRDADDVRRVLVVIAPLALFAGLSMMVEAISHTPIIKPLAASVFGRLVRYEDGVAVGQATGFVDYRLGLFRASGPFNHPILAGIFLAALLPLYWSSGLKKWPFYAGVAASFLAFFSVSSAAIFALALGIGLLAFDLSRKYAAFLTWRLMFALASIALVFGQIASEKGLSSLLIRLSLNPATGFFRRLIWRYGWISVEKNPWFGIGFKEYARQAWMVASVDNYWLLLAMRHGLIVAIAFLATTVAAIYSLSRLSLQVSERDRRLYVGLAIAVFILAIAGFSVALFGSLASWYYMLLGICLSLTTQGSSRAPAIIRPVPAATMRVAT